MRKLGTITKTSNPNSCFKYTAIVEGLPYLVYNGTQYIRECDVGKTGFFETDKPCPFVSFTGVFHMHLNKI